MANAHAELGLVQGGFDAGLTQGRAMTIFVLPEEVLTYCSFAEGIFATVQRSRLAASELVDAVSGTRLVCTRRTKKT